MSNTLGLDDDLEPVQIVRLLEESLGLRFADIEVSNWFTVGDIYDTLRRRFDSQQAGGKCATAMAFYRLRRALKKHSASRSLQTRTPLVGLGGLSPRKLFAELKAETGLLLPGLDRTWIGRGGLVVTVLGSVAPMGLAMASNPWWPLFALTPLFGLLIAKYEPRRIPQEYATLGQLAESVAGLNYGALILEGAGRRDKDLWHALTEILSTCSRLRKSEIRADTFLLQKQLESA